MKHLFSLLCFSILALSGASCRSDADFQEFGTVPEMLEFSSCHLPEPCFLVTPETLKNLPDPMRSEAGGFCGRSDTVIAASSVRPRYFRLLRETGRLLLGTVELPATAQNDAYLVILTGISASSVRSIKLENQNDPDIFDTAVFVKWHPELAERLNSTEFSDRVRVNRICRELLSRDSTRNMVRRKAEAGTASAAETAAADAAVQEQLQALEEILKDPAH